MAELWGIYDDMSYVLTKEEEIELILEKLDFYASPRARHWWDVCEKAGCAGWDIYGHWKEGRLPIQRYKNYDSYPEGIVNDKHGYNQWTRDLIRWILFVRKYDCAYKPELVPEKPVRELIRITGLPEYFIRGYLAYEGRDAAFCRKYGKKYRMHDMLDSPEIKMYGYSTPASKTLYWAIMTTSDAYKE